MTDQTKESRGFMYVAKRPCGRVSAMSWDDKGYERDIAKSVASWIKRGDTVTHIEVFVGDPMPEQTCNDQEICVCEIGGNK